MTEVFDPTILAFFARLPRQAPGGDAETAAVLDGLAGLPPHPRAADFGCGTGRSALLIAERLKARVFALDRAGPFLDRLRAEAAARGLLARMDVCEADMAAPPVAPGTLDLLWSEGAAYILGFANALRLWRPLLRPEGVCVVSECSWLTTDPPPEATRFWRDAYPEMAGIEANCRRAAAAGYLVEETRILPASAWRDYYDSIRLGLEDPVARLDAAFVAALETEIAMFERFGASYGYVFYILRREVDP